MITSYEQKRIHDQLKIKQVGSYYDRIFKLAKSKLLSGFGLSESIIMALNKYGF